MGNRVYLAAAWGRKDEVRGIADQLIGVGINVRARWLYEPPAPPTDYARHAFLQERAQIDVDDVIHANVLVRFSDDLSMPTVPSSLATGSRMFEQGVAKIIGDLYDYGAGETLKQMGIPNKRVIVIGGNQCVFDYLPNIIHVRYFELMHLKTLIEAPVEERPGDWL